MMNLFFSKEISPPLFTFNPEESRHIVKVLRLTKHHRISITDGAGRLYSGKIIDDNIKKCTVELDDTVVLEQKKDYKLHIAIALTKNLSRIEWFVEKAVEVGIDEITPMLCRHSERIHFKADRLEKIAIAAVKQ
jgi:16S rRNA (uracil1498-N3)-methyltransferase